MKFKTNLKCAACLEKVTPGLNELIEADSWEVDLTDTKRVLTTPDGLDIASLKDILQQKGYQAEELTGKN